MSYQYFGSTDTTNVRQAAIAQLVLAQMIESTRIAPTVTDYSFLAQKGNKSVSIPRGSDLTVGAKSEDTALNAQHFTYGADAIDLAQRGLIVDIDDIARVQSTFDIEMDLISRMAVAMSNDLDATIYAQLKLASTTTPTHVVKYTDTSNNDLEIKDIVNSAYLMNVQKIPSTDRYMLINPLQYSYLQNIDTFVEAHRLGSTDSIQNGFLGKIFGFNVILNTVGASDNYTLFYHKSACAYAIQDGVNFEEERYIKTFSNIKAANYIVGAKVMDSGKRVVRVEPT